MKRIPPWQHLFLILENPVPNQLNKYNRRDFTLALAASAGTLVLGEMISPIQSTETSQVKKRNVKLGFDNFSVRAFGWNASQLLDYGARLQVDAILCSDLGVYESFEERYLQDLRGKAESLGIDLQVGTVSICPTSNTFNNNYGSADEHLSLLLRVAKALGSPVARCYLGHGGDRLREGGIRTHMASMLEVLKRGEKQAVEAGVKIAIENHAGDMQAWELAELIESAGKHFVGATMDSGNATWVLEDPMTNLEVLGPHAATTGMRDSAVWETEKGAAVQWTDHGDGHVDWLAYVDRFEKLCPGVTFILEIISGGPREFNYLEDDLWKAFPEARARDFMKFLRMAKRGKPPVIPEGIPTGSTPKESEQLKQAFDLERSLDFCRRVLGLGAKV